VNENLLWPVAELARLPKHFGRVHWMDSDSNEDFAVSFAGGGLVGPAVGVALPGPRRRSKLQHLYCMSKAREALERRRAACNRQKLLDSTVQILEGAFKSGRSRMRRAVETFKSSRSRRPGKVI
jgi:hypothetical protein